MFNLGPFELVGDLRRRPAGLRAGQAAGDGQAGRQGRPGVPQFQTLHAERGQGRPRPIPAITGPVGAATATPGRDPPPRPPRRRPRRSRRPPRARAAVATGTAPAASGSSGAAPGDQPSRGRPPSGERRPGGRSGRRLRPSMAWRPKREGQEEGQDRHRRAMSVVDHLRELRDRLIWSMIAIAVGAVVCFIFFEPIIDLMVEPYRGRLTGQEGLIFTQPARSVHHPHQGLGLRRVRASPRRWCSSTSGASSPRG